MKKIILVMLLLQAILFNRCSDDDEILEDKGSMEVSVDGKAQDVSNLSATLTVSSGSATTSGHASHTLRITGGVGNDSLIVRISNWDFQAPPDNAIHVKDYYDNFMDSDLEVGENDGTCMRVASNRAICEGTIITYLRGDKSFGVYNHEENVALLSLTKCDGKKFSGSFALTIQNAHAQEETLEINVVFKDISYTVKNN